MKVELVSLDLLCGTFAYYIESGYPRGAVHSVIYIYNYDNNYGILYIPVFGKPIFFFIQ